MTHEHGHEHDHEHGHEHGQQQVHPSGEAGQSPDPGGTAARGGEPGAQLDRDRLLVLLRNWMDHNEGHRHSYLQWRDRLAAEGLPVTTAAMDRLAALADEANTALRNALDELGGD